MIENMTKFNLVIYGCKKPFEDITKEDIPNMQRKK
jgi:hypothetical protein